MKRFFPILLAVLATDTGPLEAAYTQNFNSPQRANIILIFAALLLAPLSVALASPKLATDKFANVFMESETVRLSIEPGGLTVALYNASVGKEIAQKNAPAGEASFIDFGLLGPGYYEAVAGDSVLPLVVLIDPQKRVRGESRLATDNAMSWLVKPGQYEEVARLLSRVGIGWVRERMSWGEVESRRGALDWGRYEHSADALSRHHIKILQILHAIPGWARQDKVAKAAPDDLRDTYRFAQSMARQFRGRIHAYEPWNEPDISMFFSHPASECAAHQKAAYLGFRSEDRDLLVLGPSIAFHARAFAKNLLANGAGGYMDAWNYHIYADPSQYAERQNEFRTFLEQHGLALPTWVTEAGCTARGPGGVLTPESRMQQAAFISRAFPQSLAAGVECHFWFIFPFFHNHDIGRGLFEPDMRAPYPGLAALSTATYALGRGDYLGSVAGLSPDVRAHAFDRGDSTVALAVWRESDETGEVAIPLQWQDLQEARDHVGALLPASQGPVSISVGRATVYLIAQCASPDGKLVPSAARAPIQSTPPPSLPEVVTRLAVEALKVDKRADNYVVPPGSTTVLSAEVYNFSKEPFSGDLRFFSPAGWPLATERLNVFVPCGGRIKVPLRVEVPRAFSDATIRMVATAAGEESSPAIVSLQVDPNTAPAKITRPMPLQASTMQKRCAGHGIAAVMKGKEDGICFSLAFHGEGDRWGLAEMCCDPPLDLSAYDGLRFEYRTSTTNPGDLRIMLGEPGGAFYQCPDRLPAATGWQPVMVFFKDMAPYVMARTPPDENGFLNMETIAILRFTAKCAVDKLTLEVRRMKAIKF